MRLNAPFLLLALASCTAFACSRGPLGALRLVERTEPEPLAPLGPKTDPYLPPPPENDRGHARAEDTETVFAAVICAYEGARALAAAPIDGDPHSTAGDEKLRNAQAQRATLDGEIARIRGMFRGMGVSPRRCSDPLVGRLAGCIRVWFEEEQLLGGWRAGAECSSDEIARYK